MSLILSALSGADSVPTEASGRERRADAIVRSSAALGERAVREYAVEGAAPPLAGGAGVHRRLPHDWTGAGAWEEADGRQLWRVGLRSDGAQAIRIHFSSFQAGSGEVRVFDGRGGAEPVQTYSGAGPFGDGEFWSGAVFTDLVVIEYRPASVNADLPFQVDRISHIVLQPNRALKPGSRQAAASCQQDVTCLPDYGERTAKGVALLLLEGEDKTWSCTGALLNSRSRAFRPYLLTAQSCVMDEAVAKSLEAIFHYQSKTCDGGASMDDAVRVSGARIVATGNEQEGNYSLLLLNQTPADQVFMGWRTAAPEIGERLAVIHHPEREHKRIAFGKRIEDAEEEGRPGDKYFRVQSESGRVENGSTGAPLMTEERQITGVLSQAPRSGGEDVCTIEPHVSSFGRLEAFFEALREYIGDERPELLSPANGASLASAETTFSWSAGTGVDEYVLMIGSAEGERDVFTGGTTDALSLKVTGLPTDGRDLYVQLYARFGGDWKYRDYRVKAVKITFNPAEITSPSNNGSFAGANVTFEWSAGLGVAGYRLVLGNREGASDLFDRTFTNERSFVVAGMPMDGRRVYARLYSRAASGDWQFRDSSYRAAQAPKEPAELLSPRSGTTFSGDSEGVLFTWTGGKRVQEYGLEVGNFRGGYEYASEVTKSYSIRVRLLPRDGRTVHVRLYSRYDDKTVEFKDYQFMSHKAPASTTPPDLTILGASMQPVNVERGKKAGFAAIAYNLGDEAAPAFSIGIYMSKSLKPEDDIYLGQYCRVPPGLDYAPFLCVGEVEMPDDVEPGQYYLTAMADHHGEVVESNESNNRVVSLEGRIGVLSDGPSIDLSKLPPNTRIGTLVRDLKASKK